METKEPIKIKLKTFVILIIVLIIILSGIYFYSIQNQKNKNLDTINDNTIKNNAIISNSINSNNEISNFQEEDNNTTTSQTTNEKQLESKVYSIKNSDFSLYEDDNRAENYRGVKLLEYDNSLDEYAEIYYISYDYSTDPSFYYTLEITDENDSSLLLNGEKEQRVDNGIVSTIKVKKQHLNDRINFAIFEKEVETSNITASSKIQIDLGKNLEEISKIDQSANLKDGKLGGISFKYIDSEYVYFGTTSHGYSENLVGENASLPIKIQFGNRLLEREHIEFSYNKNVNELELSDAFESLKLINDNFGQYGLSDIYGIHITNEQGDITDTVIISYEEIIKLCNGMTIEKDGKEYTKDSLNCFSTIEMIKESNVKLADEIDAIKYYFTPEKEYYDWYMFIYEDKIYNIKTPKNERIQDEVQMFLESLNVAE